MAELVDFNLSHSVVYRVLKSLLNQKIWGFQKRQILKPISDHSNFVFIYYPNSIAEAQLYPFYENRHRLLSDFDINLSAICYDRLANFKLEVYPNVKTLCFQCHFSPDSSCLIALLSKLREAFPNAQFIYFDWFAHNDLRLMPAIGDFFAKYVKKTIFRDEHDYYKTTYGDTNLMDYYGKLYECSHTPEKYSIPRDSIGNLIVGAGFLTSPYLVSLFSTKTTITGSRPIDLNARFSSNGHDWYRHMRSAAMTEVDIISESFEVVQDSVNFRKYLTDIGKSKITFSPFGYGEICWRDYEAFALGSLLIKPDMSHLICNPEIFIPYETYIPISWDFSDFNEKVRYYINNQSERIRIAKNAFDVGYDFHKNRDFLSHIGELL